jgi:hypothetical protein
MVSAFSRDLSEMIPLIPLAATSVLSSSKAPCPPWSSKHPEASCLFVVTQKQLQALSSSSLEVSGKRAWRMLK